MKYLLLILTISVALAQTLDLSEEEINQGNNIGKLIIDDLNTYRESVNLFKKIQYDDQLMNEALKEVDYLRKNPDDFKLHANYDDRLDQIENIYYTELFAKLLIKENPSNRALTFWKESKYDIELKREYVKAGAACLEYSSGWICVLELMNSE